LYLDSILFMKHNSLQRHVNLEGKILLKI